MLFRCNTRRHSFFMRVIVILCSKWWVLFAHAQTNWREKEVSLSYKLQNSPNSQSFYEKVSNCQK
jgi:hypothetical protein